MLFSIKNQSAQKVLPTKVGLERDIQRLFEKNLEAILDIKLLASEYSTSFGGRIDSLGIDNTRSGFPRGLPRVPCRKVWKPSVSKVE